MFPTFTRTIDPSEFERFVNSYLVKEYELPQYNLGSYISSGTNYNQFSLVSSDEVEVSSERVTITLTPVENCHTVDMEDAKEIGTGAVVIDRDSDTSWYLPPNVVSEVTVLPTLVQSFYKGESYSDREADYEYRFESGDVYTAVPASNPIPRLEEEIVIEEVEYAGGMFPQRFYLTTESGDELYLRERSGSIRLYDSGEEDMTEEEIRTTEGRDEIFNAYIGREHPGTRLLKEEVINIITSVEYINKSETISMNF